MDVHRFIPYQIWISGRFLSHPSRFHRHGDHGNHGNHGDLEIGGHPNWIDLGRFWLRRNLSYISNISHQRSWSWWAATWSEHLQSQGPLLEIRWVRCQAPGYESLGFSPESINLSSPKNFESAGQVKKIIPWIIIYGTISSYSQYIAW